MVRMMFNALFDNLNLPVSWIGETVAINSDHVLRLVHCFDYCDVGNNIFFLLINFFSPRRVHL